MKLFLYEAIRWGCDEHATHDTIFLISAENLSAAAEITDAYLKTLPHKRVPSFCQRICELGPDPREAGEPAKILGPCFDHAYDFGWKAWDREDENGSWRQFVTEPPSQG